MREIDTKLCVTAVLLSSHLLFLILRVYFNDESYKSFMCDQNTTVEEVCKQFAERTHLRDFPEAFTLKERRAGRGTQAHTHPLTLPRSPLSSRESRLLCCCLLFFCLMLARRDHT